MGMTELWGHSLKCFAGEIQVGDILVIGRQWAMTDAWIDGEGRNKGIEEGKLKLVVHPRARSLEHTIR